MESATEGCDFFSSFVHGKYVEGSHVSASFGQARGDALTESSGCAGDEGYLTVEAKVFEDGHQ